MALEVLDNGMVSDRFEFASQYGDYKDALVMTQQEYDALTEAEISALKQERFDNWLKIFETPAE